jgi:protein-tyrosine phosphatase
VDLIVRPTLYTVQRPGSGELSTMARPRGGDWLAEEMKDISIAGVGVLVSALTPTEAASLDLEGEADAAANAGLRFVGFPVTDRGIPDASAFRSLVSELKTLLEDRAHVVIHCRMGIGRSSLVAAGVLVDEGMSAADAWSAISQARGLAVPDTDEQRVWLRDVMRER